MLNTKANNSVTVRPYCNSSQAHYRSETTNKDFLKGAAGHYADTKQFLSSAQFFDREQVTYEQLQTRYADLNTKLKRRSISSLGQTNKKSTCLRPIENKTLLQKQQTATSTAEPDENMEKRQDYLTPQITKKKQAKRLLVSNFTAAENSEIEQKMLEFDRIKMKNTDMFGKQKASRTCSELIQQVQMDCKAMAYTLRRIVCNDEESHIVLGVGGPNTVDVVKATCMFFKINVAGRNTQGRMLIQYAPGQIIAATDKSSLLLNQTGIIGQKVDLKVCYSAQGQREPTENNCQKEYENPARSISLPYPPNKDHYEGDWIYLSLYSYTGCNLTINISFSDKLSSLKQQKKQQQNQAQVIDDPFSSPSKVMRKSQNTSHIIQRNITFVDAYDPNKHAKQILKQRLESEGHNIEVRNKKDERDHQKRLDKLAYLYKWDYIKKQKIEIEKEAIAKNNRIIIGTFWAKHIFLSVFVQNVYEKLYKLKTNRMLHKIALIAKGRIVKSMRKFLYWRTPRMFYKAFKKLQEEKGQKLGVEQIGLECRDMIHTKYSLNLFSQLFKKEEKAKDKFYKFMIWTSERQVIFDRTKVIAQKIQNVKKIIQQMNNVTKLGYAVIIHRLQMVLSLNLAKEQLKSKGKKPSEFQVQLENLDSNQTAQTDLAYILTRLKFICVEINQIAHTLNDKEETLSQKQLVTLRSFLSQKLGYFDKISDVIFEDKKMTQELRQKILSLEMKPRQLRMLPTAFYESLIKKASLKLNSVLEQVSVFKAELIENQEEKVKKSYDSKRGQVYTRKIEALASQTQIEEVKTE